MNLAARSHDGVSIFRRRYRSMRATARDWMMEAWHETSGQAAGTGEARRSTPRHAPSASLRHTTPGISTRSGQPSRLTSQWRISIAAPPRQGRRSAGPDCKPSVTASCPIASPSPRKGSIIAGTSSFARAIGKASPRPTSPVWGLGGERARQDGILVDWKRTTADTEGAPLMAGLHRRKSVCPPNV